MAERRALGRSGLSIAPLVLGGGVFGVGDMDRARSFAVLDAFAAGGGTLIDTADVYMAFLPGGRGGESESMIGEWIGARGRREMQIATKVGVATAAAAGGLRADYILASLDASLRRLRTDHVDIYFAHIDDPAVPQQEVAEAFDRAVRSGKARSVGASNFPAARLATALDVAAAAGCAPFSVFQPEYNLLERGFERGYRDLCMARGLGVISYAALAHGYLTGKYRARADLSRSVKGGDSAAYGGRVRAYLEGRGPAVLAALDTVADARGLSPAVIALAWLIGRPGVTAPIASATSAAQTGELMQALETRLHPDETRLLDGAA